MALVEAEGGMTPLWMAKAPPPLSDAERLAMIHGYTGGARWLFIDRLRRYGAETLLGTGPDPMLVPFAAAVAVGDAIRGMG